MNVITNYERRYTISNDDITTLARQAMMTLDNSLPNSEPVGSGKINDDRIPNDCSYEAAQILQENTDTDSDSDSSSASLKIGRWRVENKEISELPEIYPRLSCPLIVQTCEVSAIGDRLWNFLNLNNIRSVYDTNRGRVLCRTHQVSFVVQFWRRRTEKEPSIFPSHEATVTTGKDKGTERNDDKGRLNHCTEEEIILEIQRRQGCSWAMHKIRKALKKSMMRHSHSFQQCCHRNLPSSSSPSPRQRSISQGSIGLTRYEPLLLKTPDSPRGSTGTPPPQDSKAQRQRGSESYAYAA